MMKVLVIGATGFIGWPTAQALSRAGHMVYGLVRKESQMQRLKAAEIIPIVGDAAQPSSWVSIVSTMDVVIECIGGSGIKEVSPALYQYVLDAVRHSRPSSIPKLTYICTSGTWVHGDNRSDIVSDTTPLSNSPTLVSWRPEFEQQITKNQELNGIVIRPGIVHGYSGSITASFFKMAEEGKVVWYGKPGGRISFVHTEDLADLYVRVAEKAPLVGGMIFDVGNDQTEGMDELFERLFAAIGVNGSVTYVERSNAWEEAVSTSVLMRPHLAKTLLGWQPKKIGFGDGLRVYYEAWKNSE